MKQTVSLELVFERFQTLCAHVHPKHSTAVALAGFIAAVVVGCAGDEELGAGELHTSDVASRQLHLAHNLALLVDLDDSALAVDSVPNVAVNVNAEAVNTASAFMLVMDPLVGSSAGFLVEVVG